MASIYHNVIDDVINQVKKHYIEEGYDEGILNMLRKRWTDKLTKQKVFPKQLERPIATMPSTTYAMLTKQNRQQVSTALYNQGIQQLNQEHFNDGGFNRPTNMMKAPVHQLQPATQVLQVPQQSQPQQQQVIFNQQPQQMSRSANLATSALGYSSRQLPQPQVIHPQVQYKNTNTNPHAPHHPPQFDGSNNVGSSDEEPEDDDDDRESDFISPSMDNTLNSGKSPYSFKRAAPPSVPQSSQNRNASATLGIKQSRLDDTLSDDDDDDDIDEDEDIDFDDEEIDKIIGGRARAAASNNQDIDVLEEPETVQEPLGSDDDDSEEQKGDLFETDNVIVCQFDKVNRMRNKWRFNLKDGIMHINGTDHVFQKASGEAKW